MSTFDPFSLSESLSAQFKSFLLDSHPIHGTQADLLRQFRQALDVEDRFVRAPLISMIPSYELAECPDALFDRSSPPHLSSKLRDLDPVAFDTGRPLYKHQVEAIRLIQSGRNTVVATGTGSGKTECFLLPILNAAAEAHLPGSVAIIIYPMNALANDQLERLRAIVGTSSITFGRYTGQTPRTDIPTDAQAVIKRPNERFTRVEIRENPPHVLLTNFAMLEYLLLRPEDHCLFSHKTLKYVVLDEAHTYSGSQGIDVGLLMRRLQQQYDHRLQFILTSATLGNPSEPAIRQKIVSFAQALTGQDLAESDIVFGQASDPFTTPLRRIRDTSTITALAEQSGQAELESALTDSRKMQTFLNALGLGGFTGTTAEEILFNCLRQLDAVESIYRFLRRQPSTLDELCIEVFGSVDELNRRAVRFLLCAASRARPGSEHASPLMSLRIHHFFRGLNGASVAFRPSRLGDGSPVQRLYLEDRNCDEDESTPLLALRVCVHCGFPVAVVRVNEKSGTWSKPSRVAGERLRFLTWLNLREKQDAAEADSDQQDDAELVTRAYLSIAPGRAYREGSPPDDDSDYVELFVLHDVTPEGNLMVCPCCNGRARPYPTVVRDFDTGEDAPTAVLAEEIVRALPPREQNANSMPAGGRNLLAFSDSRQRAAHFNSYLTWTTCEPSFIQPLLSAAEAIERTEHRPGTVREVVERAERLVTGHQWVVKRETDDDGFDRHAVVSAARLSPEDKRRLRHELALTLYLHISASASQRTKMPGLLLAAPEIEFEDRELASLANTCPVLFEDVRIGSDAIQRLLVYLIRRNAVQYWPDSIKVAHLLPEGKGPQQVTVHRNPCRVPGSAPIRWNPYEAPTKNRANAVRLSRTAQIVRDALDLRPGDGDAAVAEVLDRLWSWLTSDDTGILVPYGTGEFQLPATRILVRSDANWHLCNRCGAPTIHPMRGTCQIHGCRGSVCQVEQADAYRTTQRSHRVDRYRREPMPLVVREHTAQLTLDHSRRYQDSFKQGAVNVLSSSTTFEMGVDVGQLQAVLLRNVPPAPANYIQRAGRAGRRRVGIAHAVTYARKLPHDQFHFFSPRDIAAGSVPVPVVYTANARLAQRHVNSYLLGQFLAVVQDQLPADNRSVGRFFPATLDDCPAPADEFGKWCTQESSRLGNAVARIIPRDCPLPADQAVAEGARSLFSRSVETAEGQLTAWYRGYWLPKERYMKESRELESQCQQAMSDKDLKYASVLTKQMGSIQRLLAQLDETRLIDFLAEQHWLPNYAFPQDIVRLTVRQDAERDKVDLDRDREIGISEYAPGSEIIADGKLFRSVGINLDRREPELKWFGISQKSRQISIEISAQALDDKKTPFTTRFQFIEPSGFTTAWHESVREPNLFRLRPPSNTEVFLVSGSESHEFRPAAAVPSVYIAAKRNGRLFRANLGRNGRGFQICTRCGLAHLDNKFPKKVHEAPYGGHCSGRFEPIVLAHQFETDILQIHFPHIPTPLVGQTDFWLTLSTALAVTACRTLSIDPSDLDSTYRGISEGDPTGEIVLYDRVPGGAGHVYRIEQAIGDLLRNTLSLLEKCPNKDCDPQSSCYACLRGYGNQFQWEYLQRWVPVQWLRQLLQAHD